jgi:RNA polymerase sigma-70 factor (ECF subfamily)
MMNINATPGDDELLRLMRAGDEEAFVALYRRRQGGIYRFALQMSGSEATAEDVTQEVFMVLMREMHNYNAERGSVAAYLYGVARNQVLRRLERERSFVSIEANDGDASNTSTPAKLVAESDPLDDLTREEMIEQVRQAVLALPAHYREVVVLCELHELSYAEAAAALSCAVGTIRSRLHRARALLYEKLRDAKVVASEEKKRPLINTARCFA